MSTTKSRDKGEIKRLEDKSKKTPNYLLHSKPAPGGIIDKKRKLGDTKIQIYISCLEQTADVSLNLNKKHRTAPNKGKQNSQVSTETWYTNRRKRTSILLPFSKSWSRSNDYFRITIKIISTITKPTIVIKLQLSRAFLLNLFNLLFALSSRVVCLSVCSSTSSSNATWPSSSSPIWILS